MWTPLLGRVTVPSKRLVCKSMGLSTRESQLAAHLIAAGRVSDPTSARGRLLREALDLFARQGYARTTVRDLARAVGIQSGSLFHHFSSKEDIFCAALGEA